MAAIHWAKIDRVVYGATIADATNAGFGELHIDARVVAELGRSPVVVQNGVLQAECAALFPEWQKTGLCKPY
jgi:tRNA(Arg) A34 adenosine deaminase TadA